MRSLLGSASKIVFIMLALASCIGFYLGLMDPKDFMILVSMAFSFYFTKTQANMNQDESGDGEDHS